MKIMSTKSLKNLWKRIMSMWQIQVQEENQESEEENKHNASVAVSSITNLQIIRYDEILDDCKSNKSIGKFVTDTCNIPDKQE